MFAFIERESTRWLKEVVDGGEREREREIEVSSNMGKLKVSGVGEKNHYNDNTI